MTGLSPSRRLSLVALMTALAIALNLSPLAFPAPYEPFLFYEVWEIPILFAVLLLGFWDGLIVAVLNTFLLLAYRPGALPVAPLYNLMAQLSMFAGVIAAERFARGRSWGSGREVALATLTGAALRTGVMTVVNAAILPLPAPFGFAIPVSGVPAFLVPIGVFNFTITLYTVPAAFSLAKAVEARYGRGLFGGAARGPLPPAGG